MTQEDAILQDVLENREDDTPRRVYADWLLDRGDDVSAARGEFIHVQCDLAREPAGSPRRERLERREHDLYETHAREWDSLFQRVGCTYWEYRRGFVDGVALPAKALLSQAATLFRATPLRRLKLYGSGGLWHELGSSAYLGRIEWLDLEKNDLGDCDLEALAASPHLGGLSTLLLWGNSIGDAGLVSLVGAHLPRLVQLDLTNNVIGDAGVMALAAAPLLSRLTILDLTGNQVLDAGGQALAASPHAGDLLKLILAKNPIGPSALNALRERFGGRVHVWG
jgi:uncharacterized protein (TIGR02996 family)